MKTFLKVKRTLLISSLSLLSLNCVAWDEQFIEDNAAVTVWTQPVSGSDFKAFKGQVTIHSDINHTLKVIRDTKNVPKWYYNSTHAEQLQRISPDQSLNYSVTSAPWPVSDRDSVILATVIRHSNGNITIQMKGQPNRYPLQEDRIRIPKLEGSWHLEKLNEQTTRVTLQVTTEPGGEIPSWLANAMVVDMPFYSLTNLKERVENLKQ